MRLHEARGRMSADTSAEGWSTPWWTPRDLDDGQCAEWVVGPLTVVVQRLANEWRTGYERSSNPDAVTAGQRESEALPDECEHLERFVSSHGERQGPASPFVLPPGESATIYVSTPLWVRLVLGATDTSVLEIPVLRPSDTWLGRTTREGELCYAARTRARLDLDAVPRHPHRAVTPLRIANESRTQLRLERVGLPVPYLSLYADPDNGLWTEQVTLRREDEDADAVVDFERGGPLPDLERVAAPRNTHREGLIGRAFSALLG
jgi:hypothetical protein